MLFPPIAITTSTPFDLRISSGQIQKQRIAAVELWVDSGGSAVYYGDIPGPVVTVTLQPVNAATQVSLIDPDSGEVPRKMVTGAKDIQIGHVFDQVSDPQTAGNFVTEVNESYFKLRVAAIQTAGEPVPLPYTFTPQAVSSSNGIPITAGTGRAIVMDSGTDLIRVGLRFVVASGTGTLRVRYVLK